MKRYLDICSEKEKEECDKCCPAIEADKVVPLCYVPSDKKEQTGIERALEIREELFDIANSYAGDRTGHVAMMLHQACNHILYAEDELKDVEKNERIL